MNREDKFHGATKAWTVIALFVLSGCATSRTQIDATYDPAADFSEFRTFRFAEPLGTDRRGRRTSLSTELTFSTMRELKTRGMQPVGSNPDLLINFFLTEQQGIDASGPFVHNHSNTSTWRGYNTHKSMSLQLVSGVLVIDIIDARRGALVFEGVAEGRITESMRDDLRETVDEIVTEIFSRMP